MSKQPGDNQATCVIVADRHPVLLRTLKRILEPEFEVIGMVDNAISLLDALAACEPDVLVVETALRHRETSLAEHLSRRFGHIPLVVVLEDQEELAVSPCAAFVTGLVSKQMAAADMCSVVRGALRQRGPNETQQ